MAKKQTKKPTEVKALVMTEITLSPRQSSIVGIETPKSMIKEKPGRGGKKVVYIEGGYVINRLNQAFSPLGWEFKIIERGILDSEVWVYGELSIIDHKNNFRTTKGQYGQHPIHKNVPLGDALKSAGTDALKKCASLLGIGLDVYWGQLDTAESQTSKKPDAEETFQRAMVMIKASNNVGGLIEYDEKLKESKLFNKSQIAQLHKAVTDRVGELDAQQA